jgi:aminoglycoside phosphotransferase
VSLSVEFSDGYAVGDLEPVPAGLVHRVFFGVEAESRLPVVVKIEQIPECLEIEHRALMWLFEREVDVPRVRWFGSGRVGDEQLARCLVTERIGGLPPHSPSSWSRMGRTLQRLEGVPWRGSGLTILDEEQFVSSHQEKINALRDQLASVACCEHPQLGPLIVTHGDPGDGNYLESDTRAVLIDWEQAQIAPRGLDLARAVFVALLRATHSESGDLSNAQAVIAGYLNGSNWSPTTSEMKWWLEVAGMQIVYKRWSRPDQPNVPSWQDAAIVLERALSDDHWLIHR